MKTLHRYFSWATALYLYNLTGGAEKLQQLHCYHQFSDSVDMYQKSLWELFTQDGTDRQNLMDYLWREQK